MPKHDRRTKTGGACLTAEKERRASNLLWVRDVRVSLAEIAAWQLGPDFIERRSERSTRVH